jgi:hypothetical protein
MPGIPNIRTATTLWMEAGAMSGPPDHRHQIEFPNDIAEYFDDIARENEVLSMRLPGGPLHARPLTYRGTDYGQWTEIWRLGLLTPTMSGPQYVGRVIRFDRLPTVEGTIYEIRVADSGSAEAMAWENSSVQTGTTGGPAGRRYGFW